MRKGDITAAFLPARRCSRAKCLVVLDRSLDVGLKYASHLGLKGWICRRTVVEGPLLATRWVQLAVAVGWSFPLGLRRGVRLSVGVEELLA